MALQLQPTTHPTHHLPHIVHTGPTTQALLHPPRAPRAPTHPFLRASPTISAIRSPSGWYQVPCKLRTSCSLKLVAVSPSTGPQGDGAVRRRRGGAVEVGEISRLRPQRFVGPCGFHGEANNPNGDEEFMQHRTPGTRERVRCTWLNLLTFHQFANAALLLSTQRTLSQEWATGTCQ